MGQKSSKSNLSNENNEIPKEKLIEDFSLTRPDPFQLYFKPEYNPYGSNYFVPNRRFYNHLGPYNNRRPFAPNAYGSFFYDPVIMNPYAQNPYSQQILNPQVMINPPCGGVQCTSYLNSSGNYESPIGTECTCCAMGKPCRMSSQAPKGVEFNDCCSGLECINSVCMKK